MAVQRNSAQPAGITNASGQPEIVLELDGLVLSMTPPGSAATADSDSESESESDEDGDDDEDGDADRSEHGR